MRTECEPAWHTHSTTCLVLTLSFSHCCCCLQCLLMDRRLRCPTSCSGQPAATLQQHSSTPSSQDCRWVVGRSRRGCVSRSISLIVCANLLKLAAAAMCWHANVSCAMCSRHFGELCLCCVSCCAPQDFFAWRWRASLSVHLQQLYCANVGAICPKSREPLLQVLHAGNCFATHSCPAKAVERLLTDVMEGNCGPTQCATACRLKKLAASTTRQLLHPTTACTFSLRCPQQTHT